MSSARADKPTKNVAKQNLLTKIEILKLSEKKQNNVYKVEKENKQRITPKGSSLYIFNHIFQRTNSPYIT